MEAVKDGRLYGSQREMNTQKYDIKEITNIVAPIAREFGIGKISLFGSYARGEATIDSDLDFHIIDCGSLHGLFSLSGFELALEDRFKVPVDVIVGDSTYSDVYQAIQHEEIVIYLSASNQSQE